MNIKQKTYVYGHNIIGILLLTIAVYNTILYGNSKTVFYAIIWGLISAFTCRFSFDLKVMDFLIGAVYLVASIFLFEWYYIPLIAVTGQGLYRISCLVKSDGSKTGTRPLSREILIILDWVIELTITACLVDGLVEVGNINLTTDVWALLWVCALESFVGLLIIYTDLKLFNRIESFWGDMKTHLKETWAIYLVYFCMVINVAVMYQEYRYVGVIIASSYMITLKIAFNIQSKVTQIEEESYIDVLTGVKNKKFYLEHIPEELKGSYGVFFIDFNGFKKINDTYGHDVGDAVIIHGSQILKAALRDRDDIIRFGGDEFMLLVRDADKDACEDIISRIDRLCNEMPYTKDGLKLYIGMAIGVALCPEESFVKDDLATIADDKMYIAKRNKGEEKVVYKI